MKRKIFNSLVFLVFFTALSAVFVFNSSAAGYSKQGDFTFYIDGAKATVTQYNGTAAQVTVPSKVGSATVVAVGSQAFWAKKNITSVSLPSTIQAIGKAAFNECTGITKLVLPSSLKVISDSAFWYCTGLRAMYIPPSVTSISSTAFKGCSNLTAYVIPGSYAEKFVSADPNVKLGYRFASSVKFISSKTTVAIGSTPKLIYTVYPSNVYSKAVVFKSSNPAVATVSAAGVVTPLKCGQTVITVTTADGSNKSSQVTVTVVPQQVTGVAQPTTSASGYTITWNASRGAASYGIYRYNTSTKAWELVSIQSVRSYSVTGLKPGNYADYRILAFTKIGSTFYKALPSATFRATVLTPGTVSNVKVTQAVNSVQLSWPATVNTTGYNIYIYNQLSKRYELYTQTPKTSVIIKNLPSNSKNIFAVRSYLIYGGKTYFAPSYAGNIIGYTLPERVTGLKADASSLTQTSARLTWNMLKGVSGYELYRVDNDSKTLIAKLGNCAFTGYTVDGLEPGKAVKYIIRAYDSNGTVRYGQFSDTVTVQTATAPANNAEAFNGFIDALNSSKSSQDSFYLIKTTEVSNLAGNQTSDCAEILDTVAKTNFSKLYFKNGLETETALTAESFVSPHNTPSQLKLDEVKSFEYSEDGDGYKVIIELKEETEQNGVNAKIAPVINWGVVAGQHNGFVFERCLYEGTVIEAKVLNGKIEYMTITMPLQFAFTFNSSPYLFSETITHNYIFGW